MCQCREEARHQSRESNETRLQTEEDADRELLNMRVRHEKIVREEQVMRHSQIASPPSYLSHTNFSLLAKRLSSETLNCNLVNQFLTHGNVFQRASHCIGMLQQQHPT